jgi:aspartate 4-decarboxylase
LAQTAEVILMEGVGFGASSGELRISFSNLPDDAYPKIAKGILEVLQNYFNNFVKN